MPIATTDQTACRTIGEAPTSTMLRRLRTGLVGALPFGLAYGIATTASVMLTLHLREVGMGERAAEIIRTMWLGSTVGGALAWAMATTVAGNRPATARFAAMLVASAASTSGAMALVYFLKFYSYFYEFHEPFGTMAWIIQTLFTGAGAAYVFASLGLRILLPLGLVPLFGAAWIFARRPRH